MYQDKDASTRLATTMTLRGEMSGDIFHVHSDSFKQVPGSPFLYWVSERVRRLFRELPPLESDGRENRVGLQTSDNFRFLRCWWEVSPSSLGTRWFPYAKGGGYSPYYRDLTLCVNWFNNGAEIKEFARELGNSPSRSVRSEDHYFRPALTYSDRCTGGFATSPLPSGAIFDVKGSCIFAESDGEEELLSVLAITLSNPFRKLMALRSGTHSLAQSFQVGQISSTPFPTLNRENSKTLAGLARKAHLAKRELLRLTETDHTFTGIQIGKERDFHFEARLINERITAQTDELKRIQDQLDAEASQLYSLPEEDLAQLLDKTDVVREVLDIDDSDGDENQVTSFSGDRLVRSFVQWSIGLVFGRWDIRRISGDAKELPGPFEKLPVCSLGMLQGDDGLPLADAPDAYPLQLDSDGILADDANRKDDIVRRIRDVFELIWRDRAEFMEIEACQILGVKSLREYLRKTAKGGFWEDHASCYTKSGRRAPVFWPLQSSRKNYCLWLYYQRLDKDLLFKALVNHVEPKIRLEINHLES